MTTLMLISFLTIATYTAIVSIKSGIPYSISETYYRINHKKWFTFVMLFTAITLLPAALEYSSDNSQFLIFLSVAGMGFVGLSPNFIHGEKSEQIAHYVGSGMLLIFSQCWVGCNLPWALTWWIVYVMWIIFNYNLKSATKLFSVLLASKRPLITELADKLRLKYPLLPTISPCPTMRLEAIRSIIPISCRRYPKSV